jgi:hypothetical protein
MAWPRWSMIPTNGTPPPSKSATPPGSLPAGWAEADGAMPVAELRGVALDTGSCLAGLLRCCPSMPGTVSGHGLSRGGRGAPSRELVGPGTGVPLVHHVYRSQTACGEATESSRLGAWVTAAAATRESGVIWRRMAYRQT